MTSDNLSKSERILAGILIAIFVTTLTCVAYALIMTWQYICMHTLHVDFSTSIMIFMCLTVIVGASTLVFRIYQLQKSNASWSDLDNPKVFETIRLLASFPLIPGLIIVVFCIDLPFGKMIGLAMMELSFVSTMLLTYRSFCKTKGKLYLFSLAFYLIMICGGVILMLMPHKPHL